MQPSKPKPPPAPVLSFPPTPASRPLPPYAAPAPPPPRPSALKRSIAALPLVFIYALLAFVTYAFLFSLCGGHVLLTERSFRGVVEAAFFIWLCGGVGWSLAQCFLRGGGAVPRPDLEAAGRSPSSLPAAAHPSFPHAPMTKPKAKDSNSESAGLLAGASSEEDEDELDAQFELLDRRRRGVSSKLEARSAVSGSDRRSGRGWDFGAALRELEEEGPPSVGGRTSIQAKSDGSQRYCRKCRCPKPDRTHHCSSCGVCVLKMDHHCPWLGGGCVGWANYKFFLLFLWYSGALGWYVGVVSAWELANFVGTTPDGFELAPISWAIAMLLGFIFGFAVGGFGLYHLWLACKNRSTIEAMERAPAYALPNDIPRARWRDYYDLSRDERRRLDKAASAYNVYDLGMAGNLASIFGGKDKMWEWGLPIGWPPGDGQSFEVDRSKLEKLREINVEVRLVRDRVPPPPASIGGAVAAHGQVRAR